MISLFSIKSFKLVLENRKKKLGESNLKPWFVWLVMNIELTLK